MTRGIDISVYQGEVDFDSLKSQVDFVFIRASFGAPEAGQAATQYTDGQFARNQAEARRVGIQRGYYHYAYPQFNSAEAEAHQFLSTIGTLEPGELIALDFEEKYLLPSGWCKEFLDIVSAVTGCTAFIYMNLSTARRYNWSSVNATYPLWLAEWNGTPENFGAATWPAGIVIHQYGLVDFMHADGDAGLEWLGRFSKPANPNVLADARIVPVVMTCHVTGKNGVYIRTSPRVGSDNHSYVNGHPDLIPQGGACDYIGTVQGEKVNGSSLWLLKPDGLYVFAGLTDFKPKSI